MGKKVMLKLIEDETARKASYKKRRAGLEKKVRELSTLCGVSASLIIYGVNDREPITWPSQSEVHENLVRFYSMEEVDRSRKMVDQETYLKEKISKMEEQLEKQRRKNKQTQVSDLMHICQSDGFDKLSVNDLECLIWFVQEKRTEIKKRLEYLQQTPLYFNSYQLAPPSSATNPNQAPEVVLDRVAPATDNIDGSNYEQTPQDSNLWEHWFADLVRDSNNITGTSTMANTDCMTRQNASHHQPFGANSSGGNQLGLADFMNFESHSGDSSCGNQMDLVDNGNFSSFLGGFDGTDINMRWQPHEGFEGLMNTMGSDMPFVQLQPPPYNEGNNNRSHFTLGSGLQINEKFIGMDKSSKGKNVITTQLPSHFEGSSSGSDIAMEMQPLQDAGTNTGGNADNIGMGFSSEFPSSNITASDDIRFPFDVTKEWLNNSCP